MRFSLPRARRQTPVNHSSNGGRGVRYSNGVLHAGAVRVSSRRGFSILELIVVIAVTMLLMAILAPAMSAVRENANRVICMSNMRQIGQAVSMFASDHNDSIPQAQVLDEDDFHPQDLIVAHRGYRPQNWDGLGLLYQTGYCAQAECFYCPSHHGEHTFEDYEQRWSAPTNVLPIYTNYHYGGHLHWETRRPRALEEGVSFIIATDGLRTRRDVNHVIGMNVLRADGSVNWKKDNGRILELVPDKWGVDDEKKSERFVKIWPTLESSD